MDDEDDDIRVVEKKEEKKESKKESKKEDDEDEEGSEKINANNHISPKQL